MKNIFIKKWLILSLVVIIGLATDVSAYRRTYTTADGLASNSVNAIAIDSLGNKWFGTSNGVSKFDGTTWTNYTTNQGLGSNYVVSIAIDNQGNKWFGIGGGVSKFDGTNWTTYTTSYGLVDTVYSIATDDLGNKWFAVTMSTHMSSGVSKFDGVTWTLYTTSNTSRGLGNNVGAIAIDSQGNKWFATENGVSKFDDTTWTTYTSTTSTSNGLVSNSVRAIAIDSQGNKWFGTNAGVSKFDGSTWTTYTTNQGLVNNYVKVIAIDSQGNKWFGTIDGVSKFDGTTWTTYTTNQGLGSNYIVSIAIDSQGNKWFGTNNGVTMVSSDNIWNVAPVLALTGETGYVSDGISPDTGTLSTSFVFRVKYSDANNDTPKSGYPKLHIKKSGVEINESPFTMNTVDSTQYSGGRIYSCSTTLSTGTDYTYYFEAYDIYNASATQLISGTGPIVVNNYPVLSWTGETDYVADGINVETGNNSTAFNYKVKYTDVDNHAPKSGYPKVHIQKSGVAINSSPFAMNTVDSTQYSGGRVYSYLTTLSTGTDYTYYFEAYDIYDATATGVPVTSVDAPDVIIPTSTADHYEITVPTSNIIAGNSFTITIFAKDNSSNTITNYSGSVNIQAVLASDTSRAGSGILSVSNATLTNGTVTIYNQSYTKGENIKIKITDGNNNSSTSNTVTILPSSDIAMSVTANPLSVVNGQDTQIIVTITDYYNNPVPNQTVNFTIAKGSGTLSAGNGSSDSLGKVTITFTPALSGSGNCIILAELGLLQREVTINVSMLIVAGNGAVVANADDPQTKIVIPSGVLTRNTLVNINKQTASPGDGQQFEITAKNQDTNEEIRNLDSAVDLILHYQIGTDGKIANTNVLASEAADKLELYYDDGAVWQKIGGSVSIANQTITAKTTHLSKYALKETVKTSAFRFSGIGPNPFSPNPDGINDRVQFYFDNPENKDGEIKIYDAEGILVRTIPIVPGIVPYWDGRDANNNLVEGGIYLYSLRVGDKTINGTIVLGK